MAFAFDSIKLPAAERHLRLYDRRLDAAQVAHSVRTAGIFDDPAVKVEHLCQREVTH